MILSFVTQRATVSYTGDEHREGIGSGPRSDAPRRALRGSRRLVLLASRTVALCAASDSAIPSLSAEGHDPSGEWERHIPRGAGDGPYNQQYHWDVDPNSVPGPFSTVCPPGRFRLGL